MSTRSRSLALALPVCGAVAAVGGAAPAGAPAPSFRPTLTRITDHRFNEMAGEDSDNFGSNRLGLTLTYDLNLPEGLRFASFDAKNIKVGATDSAGTDLTAVTEDVFGHRRFVSPVQTWSEQGAQTDGFKLQLASPARIATSFSLTAVIPTQVFNSTEDISFRAATEPSSVPTAALGEGYTVTLAPQKGGQTKLTITPGTAKDMIETISLVSGRTTVKSNGSMWNDLSLTYFFDAKVKGNALVQVTVRRGLRTIPLMINLQDTPLP